MKQDITLTLSVNEVNIILGLLASQPFNQVFELIGKIHDQANQQLNTEGLLSNGTLADTESPEEKES